MKDNTEKNENSIVWNHMQIRYLKLFVTIRFIEDSNLPKYKVSMIRGGIGEMLLRAYCIYDRNCEECSFQEECIVQRIYYHHLKIVPDYVQGKESLGYLYECNDYRTNFHKGDTLTFSIILFGDVVIYASTIIQAIYRLGMFGIGSGCVPFQVDTIKNQRKEQILQDGCLYIDRLKPDQIQDYIKNRIQQEKEAKKVKFLMPLTLKYERKKQREFSANALADSIYRRIYLLNCMEGIEMERRCPFRDSWKILEQKTEVVKIPRYSNTAKECIYLEGIKGSFLIEEIEEEFLPYLYAGELVHIGKNTSMGFGQYKIGEKNVY